MSRGSSQPDHNPTRTRRPSTLIAASHLSADDRDILAGISVMVLAIANRQNLADQPHMQDEDESEGMEPAPCGMQNPDDSDRCCISEVGHKGRHKYRPINGMVN